MKNYTKYILAAVALVALIVLAKVSYDYLTERYSADELLKETTTAQQSAEDDTTEAQTQTAPDFTVLNSELEEVSLSDYKGKPVVVNFWATWCGPCKSELGYFEEAYKQYGDEVEFLMVNLTDGQRETVESVTEFVEDNGYTFPVYYDTTYSAAVNYQVSSVPLTVFIDKDGSIANYRIGAMSNDELLIYISQITGGNTGEESNA
ncbi:MAG: TlpA family protein disulfide reductase [Eubacterium sp.]|uniref:TlpA family protein disulfide reductase n=1 Tax=Eubacterium sp. TaxID=142586 RepID=UPI003A1B3C68